MKQIHIKINDSIHQKLRIQAAEEGVSMQQYVERLLWRNLNMKMDIGSSPKFIDLFAGIGGIRLPFDELGYECVFSSEIDKFAQKTYQSYFDEIPAGDITQIEPETLPDFDILLAGFPCQPFSQAGLKKGFMDTRGTMFFYIENIIKIKKPNVIFLENVKGLRNHDKGRTFKTICNSLEQLGYSVKSTVLAAKDFGLPQHRERIYIVAFKDKNKAEQFSFPTPSSIETKVGDILEESVDDKYTISDKLWAGHQRRKKAHRAKGNGFGYSLFNAYSPYTSTISARYYKDGSEILIEQQGKNPRKITPTEAARLQGFPDSIVDKARLNGVSDAQLYKQLGNAVAVSVVRAIAKHIDMALHSANANSVSRVVA